MAVQRAVAGWTFASMSIPVGTRRSAGFIGDYLSDGVLGRLYTGYPTCRICA
jgi:hypothetical protein